MTYQRVSDEPAVAADRAAEAAAMAWLAQRLCFEAWLVHAREARPEPRRGLSAAA